jgi:hypothetical protein
MNDNETAPLVTSYVEVLTRVLAGKEPDVSASGDITAADSDDPIKRQAYMRTLVDEGRKKVAPSTMITKRVGDVVRFIEKAKQMIDVAIQNIPQAALPWAGVCIGLQVTRRLSYVERLALDPLTPYRSCRIPLKGWNRSF